eukprot:TRINITY_DN2578_c0_g1_i3.p2 TRINITY_DN2578_c0_g1~~TRINITY_DN2578_c0_g1_i3.p2  ORF type:complete len:188 (-),score=53.53 TRINITY_DN2578_c0_g1_i3:805-1368(-)
MKLKNAKALCEIDIHSIRKETSDEESFLKDRLLTIVKERIAKLDDENGFSASKSRRRPQRTVYNTRRRQKAYTINCISATQPEIAEDLDRINSAIQSISHYVLPAKEKANISSNGDEIKVNGKSYKRNQVVKITFGQNTQNPNTFVAVITSINSIMFSLRAMSNPDEVMHVFLSQLRKGDVSFEDKE